MAFNCSLNSRIAGAFGPYFCSHSLSNFLTESSFIKLLSAITYKLRANF